MTRIILDAAMRSKLKDLREPADLCDETGKVLAHITPVLDPSQWEPVEMDLPEEEKQRRRKEPHYSTDNVIAYLAKR